MLFLVNNPKVNMELIYWIMIININSKDHQIGKVVESLNIKTRKKLINFGNRNKKPFHK